MNNNIYNLANYLTMSRVVMIPIVMYFLSSDTRFYSFMASALFFFASLTDWVDGYIARRNKLITVFGKFLDPLADKLMVISIMIMLIPLGRIDAWIVVVIIAREVTITGLRSIASTEGIVLAAGNLGKYKTGFQLAALVGLTMHYEYYGFDFHFYATILLWIALVLTLWSGFEYLRQLKRLFTK